MPGPFTSYFLSVLFAAPFTTLSTEIRSSHCDLYGDPLPPGAVARLGTARLRHSGRVTDLAFLSDGTSLLAADETGQLILWDVKTGRRLRKLIEQHAAITRFALSRDGATVAVVALEREVALWDVARGSEIGCFVVPRVRPFDKLGRFRQVAFSPDGKFVAAATSCAIVFWDRQTGRSLRLIEAQLGEQSALALSSAGQVLASSARGVFLWDAGTGMQVSCLRGPEDESGPARPIAFTPDGTQFVVADPDLRGVAFWDTRTGREMRRAAAVAPVAAIALSPDGKALAVSDRGGGITLRDTATLQERHRILRADGDCPDLLTFSPDGRLLAAASGQDLRLWETATGREAGVTARHHGEVMALACSPDGKTIATGSTDATVRLWDRGTGKELRCLRGHTATVRTLAFAPDGKSLASDGLDGTLRLWDPATGRERRRFFDPGTATVRSAALRRTVECWRWEKARRWYSVTRTPAGRSASLQSLARIYSLAWSPDGLTLIAASPPAEDVCRWEVATGKALPPLLALQGLSIAAVFSPDGRLIASSGQKQGIMLWDAADGRALRQIPPGDEGGCAAIFSPDGRVLASRDYAKGQVALIEVANGGERGRLEGQPGCMTAIAFTPDGRALVTGGDDTTALVWDVYAPPLRSAHPHPAKPEALWQSLANKDTRPAYDALTTLMASPRQAVALLEKKVSPVPVIEAKCLARLIADLDHDDYATRERAMVELEAYDQQIAAPLHSILAARPGAEVEHRVEVLLTRLQAGMDTPGRVPQSRALEALEHMNAPEARALLRRLAEGSSEAWLTKEAKAALKRVAR